MKNIDSHNHVQGKSIYVDDIPVVNGTLHAAVFASHVAHGKIVNIDFSKALEITGVVRILTYKDITGQNEIGGIILDEPLMAEEVVDFIGMPIALVVATTVEIAHKAVKSIKVEIEKLEVITDPREARAKGKMIVPPRTFKLGDTENAWKDCEYIVEGMAENGGQEHLYIETQGAYAIPEENGVLKVYSSTQGPTAVQKTIARVLGIPHHKIEVEVRRLGGGFGGKEDQASAWAVFAALAASILQKPVKLVLNRIDDMYMTGKRHPYSSDFKIGLSKDLKILAYEVSFHQNAGAAADLSPAVMERTLFHATNSYFVPHVKATAYSCKTNLPPNTAFRGFGGPQGMFVIESAIAKAAQVIGVNAWDIQEKNLLTNGDEFSYGQIVAGCEAANCWNETKKNYKFEELKATVNEFNATHNLVKKGLAIMPICFGISFTKTLMNKAGALVHIYSDGSISVSTGAVEMGQGVNTKMLQVAAQIFSVSPKHIKVETTSTSRVANTSPTAASATADLNGKAVEDACNQILLRLKTIAAKELKTKKSAITLQDNWVYDNGKKTTMNWEALILLAFLNRVDLSAHGYYATPDINFDSKVEKGHPFAYHTYGTAIWEVTVDCLRGKYDFDAVHITHDFGKSMNEMIDKGQVEGAMVQGLGWMTMEELIYNKDGKLLSNALSTYKIPDIYSVPKVVNVQFLKAKGSKLAIFKSKAVGEPPLMYGLGAYFAVLNALKAFNPAMELKFSAPVTPEKALVWAYSS